MAKSIRNLKKNWPIIKRDFKDLVSVATSFESDKGLLWPSMLWGTLFAVVGTPIALGIPYLTSLVV